MLQSLSNTTLSKISPRWGLGYSAYTHFHRALPYAIDKKAFSLNPRIPKSQIPKSQIPKSLNPKSTNNQIIK